MWEQLVQGLNTLGDVENGGSNSKRGSDPFVHYVGSALKTLKKKKKKKNPNK